MKFIKNINDKNLYNLNEESYNKIKNKINFNCGEKNIYFSTKYTKKLLFDISIYQQNKIFTNYDIKHLKNDNTKNIPNINTYIKNINYYNEKEKIYNDLLSKNKKIKYIKEAVFFSSFTSCHHIITHIMFDFINQINYFYDMLKNNKELKIIIEYIPHGTLKFSNHNLFINKEIKDDYYKKNILKKKYLQDIFIEFIKKLNLNNDIIFLTNIYDFKNIDEDFLYINKLHYINLKNIDNITWLPLISKFIYNENYELIPNLLNKIIFKNSPKNINIHYKYHKKKFLILEKRIKSSYFKKDRNINIKIFNEIEKYCKEYCSKNNLKLVIWDDKFIKENSIYKQFEICNNSKIIIGFGGSFWLFNYTLQNETIIIIFDILKPEINNNINNLDITYYTYNYILKNKNIEKYLIWGNDGNKKYLDVISHILN